MALTQCPECKKNISENADSCPHCGNPVDKEKILAFKEKQKQTNKKIWIFVAISVAFFSIVMLIPSGGSSSNKSTTSRETVTNSSLDASVYQVKSWLNSNLKDPDSIEYIEWSEVQKTGTGNYKVRVKYRAKNSLGGYAVENKIFTLSSSGSITNVDDY